MDTGGRSRSVLRNSVALKGIRTSERVRGEWRSGETLGMERRRSTPRCHRRELLRSGSSPGDLDRKSTRLNSSHLGISYAVFCLKKTRLPDTFRNSYHMRGWRGTPEASTQAD